MNYFLHRNRTKLKFLVSNWRQIRKCLLIMEYRVFAFRNSTWWRPGTQCLISTPKYLIRWVTPNKNIIPDEVIKFGSFNLFINKRITYSLVFAPAETEWTLAGHVLPQHVSPGGGSHAPFIRVHWKTYHQSVRSPYRSRTVTPKSQGHPAYQRSWWYQDAL